MSTTKKESGELLQSPTINQEERRTALTQMASRVSVDPKKLLSTLKNTVFKGASDSELLALVITANEYKLNPILKELYAFPQKGGGIVPVVGIDGWLKIINRQPTLDGIEVRISPDGEEATCTIHLKDRSHPVIVTEYLSECRRKSEPWNNMPKRMLRHKAIIQGARVAFGIGGIYDEDEAKDISEGEMRNVTQQEPSLAGTADALRALAGGTETVTSSAEDVICYDAAAEKEAKETGHKEEPLGDPREVPSNAGDSDDSHPSEDRPTPGTKAYLENYKSKTGESKGKPWTLHILTLQIDGEEVEATTFSGSIGSLAEFNVDSWCLVDLEENKKGKMEVTAFQPIGEEESE